MEKTNVSDYVFYNFLYSKNKKKKKKKTRDNKTVL